MDSFHSASDLIKIRRGAVIGWRRANPPAYTTPKVRCRPCQYTQGDLFIFIDDTRHVLNPSRPKFPISFSNFLLKFTLLHLHKLFRVYLVLLKNYKRLFYQTRFLYQTLFFSSCLPENPARQTVR